MWPCAVQVATFALVWLAVVVLVGFFMHAGANDPEDGGDR